MVARRLSDVPMVLVGAPILLAEYGTPTTPEDLVDIPLSTMHRNVIQRLKLQRGHEEPVQVITQAKLPTNNDQMMVSLREQAEASFCFPSLCG